MIGLNRAMELWAENFCECPHSRTAAVRELTGTGRAKQEMERVEETRVVFRGVGAMARRLGISRPYLSHVLHGRMKPGKKLAERLARLGFKVGA